MKNLLMFPNQSHRTDQIARLVADLTAAHEQGIDLGSRVPHIQAGCERLMHLSSILMDTVENVERSLAKLGLQDQTLSLTIRQLSESTQRWSEEAYSLSAARK